MRRARSGWRQAWSWRACRWSLAGLTLAGAGCALWNPSTATTSVPVAIAPPAAQAAPDALAAAATAPTPSTTDSKVVQASAQLPAPTAVLAPKHATPARAAPVPPPTLLPIGIDTVFRLAEEQNAQVSLARARLNEALGEKDVAHDKWIPEIYAATGYYRHEGGILAPDGTFVHSSFGAMFSGLEIAGRINVQEYAYAQVNAQRAVLQQKGEVSRITSETLLDACNTYIDLLAARSGEAVAHDIEKRLQSLLDRAQKVLLVEKSAEFDVARIQAELDAEKRTIYSLDEQAKAATYKLNYLLGLDPCTELVPVDNRLVPFDLIDATPPVCDLITQALTTGPGVQEMEQLLTLIHQSIEKSKGPGRLLPSVQFGVAEGAFNGGPGDDTRWDNRLDLGVQAGWSLTQLLTKCDRDKVTNAKVAEAHLAYQDLRGKLAAGVQEARESVLTGRDQIRMSERQMDDAGKAYNLADKRLQNALPGASSDTVLAIDSLARAQVNYINSTSAYDKAQLRLMILMGPQSVIPCVGH